MRTYTTVAVGRSYKNRPVYTVAMTRLARSRSPIIGPHGSLGRVRHSAFSYTTFHGSHCLLPTQQAMSSMRRAQGRCPYARSAKRALWVRFLLLQVKSAYNKLTTCVCCRLALGTTSESMCAESLHYLCPARYYYCYSLPTHEPPPCVQVL